MVGSSMLPMCATWLNPFLNPPATQRMKIPFQQSLPFEISSYRGEFACWSSQCLTITHEPILIRMNTALGNRIRVLVLFGLTIEAWEQSRQSFPGECSSNLEKTSQGIRMMSRVLANNETPNPSQMN